MNQRRNLTVGITIGQLTIVQELPRRHMASGYARRFLVACVCGGPPFEISYSNLGRNGRCRKCGYKAITTHGATIGRARPPQYDAWLGMRARCRKRTNAGLDCWWAPEWATFDGFLANPPQGQYVLGLALCRNGDTGNYSPTNARWDTNSNNGIEANRLRITRMPDGREARHVAKANGIPLMTMHKRINLGWSVDRAVTTPVQKKRSA